MILAGLSPPASTCFSILTLAQELITQDTHDLVQPAAKHDAELRTGARTWAYEREVARLQAFGCQHRCRGRIRRASDLACFQPNSNAQ